MNKRRKKWLAGSILLALIAVVFLLTRGPEAPTPNPPGTYSFAVLGDAVTPSAENPFAFGEHVVPR